MGKKSLQGSFVGFWCYHIQENLHYFLWYEQPIITTIGHSDPLCNSWFLLFFNSSSAWQCGFDRVVRHGLLESDLGAYPQESETTGWAGFVFSAIDLVLSDVHLHQGLRLTPLCPAVACLLPHCLFHFFPSKPKGLFHAESLGSREKFSKLPPTAYGAPLFLLQDDDYNKSGWLFQYLIYFSSLAGMLYTYVPLENCLPVARYVIICLAASVGSI